MMKALNRFLVTTLLVLISLVPSSIEGANLVAIIVANVLPYYANVGRDQDVMKILDEVDIIAQQTGLKLNEHIFLEKEYNSDLVKNLENISVNPDDVILFYYTGHGFRHKGKDGDQNPWPNLAITHEFSGELKGVDHQLITEILEEKNPRLLLSIVSCCNKEINYSCEMIGRSLKLKQSSGMEREFFKEAFISSNYKRLFLDAKGKIVVSSSVPGEYSYRSPKTGTLFLTAFLESLHREIEWQEVPLWEAIFESTIQGTTKASRHMQHPQYELDLQ